MYYECMYYDIWRILLDNILSMIIQIHSLHCHISCQQCDIAIKHTCSKIMIICAIISIIYIYILHSDEKEMIQI